MICEKCMTPSRCLSSRCRVETLERDQQLADRSESILEDNRPSFDGREFQLLRETLARFRELVAEEVRMAPVKIPLPDPNYEPDLYAAEPLLTDLEREVLYGQPDAYVDGLPIYSPFKQSNGSCAVCARYSCDGECSRTCQKCGGTGKTGIFKRTCRRCHGVGHA